MLETLVTPEFWIGLGVIIWVNIILSGDNAVVIALAARSLPKHQQKQAIFWGAGAAVVLRIVLTIVAVKLLEFPFLKLIGGAALLWIAVKLLVPEDDRGGEGQHPTSHARSRHQHPARHLRRDDADGADGALSGDHHARRGRARLDS